MDNYFDLHFHPLAKMHLASNKDDPSNKAKDDMEKPITMSKDFRDYTDESVLRRFESQCCVDYLDEGKVKLGIAAVGALEFGVASSKGFIADVLKTQLKKPIDNTYFNAVREGEVSYLKLFLKEVMRYMELRKLDKDQKSTKESKLNLISRFSKNEEELDARPNLILAIEGGHNLCMKKIGNTLDYDDFKEFQNNPYFNSIDGISKDKHNPSKVLKRLYESLKGAKIDLLYLSLTHLTYIPEQHLGTHAFGAKGLKHPSFYPFGHGLSEVGKDVVLTAYGLEDSIEKKKDTGVLIDVKNLSLKSREDLYALRRVKDCSHIPLIASNVGVTGYSLNGWKDNLEVEKCVNHVDQGIKTVKVHNKPKVAGYWGNDIKKEFIFNSCTINLMDEDIVEIAKSGGLIGVSLDVDILGHNSNSTNNESACEFLTTSDFSYYFPYTSIRKLEYASMEEIRTEESWFQPNRRDVHPLSLCFNIIHIMAVIGLKTKQNQLKKKPQEFICIGSNFDGFIEPVKFCSDSRYFGDLQACLMKWLPVAAKKYQKVNGGTKDLFSFIQKNDYLKEVVSGILYNNGHDFLKSRGFLASEKTEKKVDIES